jgi:hypothetical protein
MEKKPPRTLGLSEKQWRKAHQPHFNAVRAAVDQLLPTEDTEQAKRLQTATQLAAVVGVMPPSGFDIPGARYEYRRGNASAIRFAPLCNARANRPSSCCHCSCFL